MQEAQEGHGADRLCGSLPGLHHDIVGDPAYIQEYKSILTQIKNTSGNS